MAYQNYKDLKSLKELSMNNLRESIYCVNFYRKTSTVDAVLGS